MAADLHIQFPWAICATQSSAFAYFNLYIFVDDKLQKLTQKRSSENAAVV